MSNRNYYGFRTKLLVLISLFWVSFSMESSFDHPNHLPRPLIVEYTGNEEAHMRELNEEVRFRCTSWRFAVETNNLCRWKTIPEECSEYVKDYMSGRGYAADLDRVSSESRAHAEGVDVAGDGMDAWVFDVDETLLSNLPYYAHHGYGLEIFNPVVFDKWVEKAIAPAIKPSLTLYHHLLSSGFKLILLTGRSEDHRQVTIDNLLATGFRDWHKLILRSPEDRAKSAVMFKSEKRSEMEREGYRIHGNSGDQWSDLLGSPMSARSFKLPNPMYYIP